jgi:Flp pilus assembly protein TadG
MIVIMASVLLLFGVLAIGALTIMRVVMARQEVQGVADTACLTAVGIVKHEGLPLDSAKQGRAAAIAFRNHPGLDFKLTFGASETDTSVDVQCQAKIDVTAPLAVWSSGVIGVTASAQGSLSQVTETQATRLYPKLVMVLDYSRSMLAQLGDVSSQPRSIDKLRQAVNVLLDTGAQLKYGLVIFGSGVLDSSPVALGSEATIRAKVRASPKGCPDSSSGPCLTNSSAALQQARTLLQQSGDTNEAGYVLFVSDGAPTLPTGSPDKDEDAAYAQAQKLWADDVAIFTLHIINVDKSQTDIIAHLTKFMQRLSGYPEKPSDPDYYFNASSDAGIDAAFNDLGDAIGCPLTALDPPPANPRKLHVFVKDGGVEIPVGNAALADPPAKKPGDITSRRLPFHDGNWFFYRAEDHSIYLSKPVCNRVIDEGEPVVIRSSSGRLSR